MKYLVAAFDADDLPRSFGQADTVEAAKERCLLELKLYRKEKATLGDHRQARSVYTLKSAQIEGFNDGTWKNEGEAGVL